MPVPVGTGYRCCQSWLCTTSKQTLESERSTSCHDVARLLPVLFRLSTTKNNYCIIYIKQSTVLVYYKKLILLPVEYLVQYDTLHFHRCERIFEKLASRSNENAKMSVLGTTINWYHTIKYVIYPYQVQKIVKLLKRSRD